MSTLDIPTRTPLEVAADPQEGESLAVAAYGNAMASVVSLGMLSVLHERGLLNNVRGYFAESGGAYNVVAAATGQIPMAVELFTEVLPLDPLISYRHLLSTSPALVNLPGLSHRLRTTHPLDLAAITHEPEVVIGLSRIVDAKRLAVRLGDVPPDKRLDVLERSASIPIAAGKTKVATCDGAILSPSPALAAAEAGYTHILLLANKAEQAAPWTNNIIHRMVARRLATKYGGPGVNAKQVMEEFSELFAQHARDLQAGRIGSAVVQVVRPQKVKGLPSTYTCEPKILRDGVQAGEEAMDDALTRPDQVAPPLTDSDKQVLTAAFLMTGLRRILGRAPQAEPEPYVNL
jgi:hypothetical protein